MNNPQPSPEPPVVAPRRRRTSGVFWGLVLIVVGLIIFAQQTGLVSQHFNWWAAFIIIPAFGSFSNAVNAYQSSGKFNAAVRSSIGGGLIVLMVALMFLFGLDWAVYWPLMVIVTGFSFFLNGFEGSTGAAGLVTISLWIGLGAMYLGLVFLADNLNILDPQAYFGKYQWWAVSILIVGVGAIINSLIIAARSGKFSGTAFSLVFIGLLVSATGVVALIGISWNLLGPILLIVVGLSVILGIFSRKS